MGPFKIHKIVTLLSGIDIEKINFIVIILIPETVAIQLNSYIVPNLASIKN